MTDIVKYMEAVVSKMNKDRSCDLCWIFTAPLEEQTANIYQIRDDNCDCVHIIITRENTEEVPTYGSQFYNTSQTIIRYNLTFDAVTLARLSENNWDEIKGHNKEDNRYNKYLSKIKQCLNSKKFNKFCQVLGYPMRVTRINSVTHPNPSMYDENFVGYRVNITFEEQVR